MGDGVQLGSFGGAGSFDKTGPFRGPGTFSGAGSTGERTSQAARYQGPASGSTGKATDLQPPASFSHGDYASNGSFHGAVSAATADKLTAEKLTAESLTVESFNNGPGLQNLDDSCGVGFWDYSKATAGDVFDGAIYGGFTKNESGAALTGQIVTGLIPVVGQVADTRDTIAAWEKFERGEKGSGLGLGLALAAWIPLAGDIFKNIGGAVGHKALPIFERAGDSVFSSAGISGAVSRGVGWLEKQATAAVDTMAGGFSSLKSKWFYRPTVEATDMLPPGEGQTDAIGNVLISALGSLEERELVYHHEMVHQFLSPKFLPLLEFRASARMSLYQNSSLCRYVEEALAETYAQLRVNGLSGVPKGLKFPIANGYVELKDVVTEAAVGTVAVGGASYGVYITLDSSNS